VRIERHRHGRERGQPKIVQPETRLDRLPRALPRHADAQIGLRPELRARQVDGARAVGHRGFGIRTSARVAQAGADEILGQRVHHRNRWNFVGHGDRVDGPHAHHQPQPILRIVDRIGGGEELGLALAGQLAGRSTSSCDARPSVSFAADASASCRERASDCLATTASCFCLMRSKYAAAASSATVCSTNARSRDDRSDARFGGGQRLADGVASEAAEQRLAHEERGVAV
jgi:hypothetical protein